jgi:phospholipid-binding lipoprotein MlaA
MKSLLKLAQIAAVLSVILSLTGCATGSNPKDPLENFNRAMFSFNDNVDQAVLKPTATAYQTVVPSIIQTAIGNFFGNIGDVWTAVNNLLQGNIEDGVTDVMRVAVNSTLGIGGLIDLGSEYGMAKHKQDFGATLGTWGIESGPYVVLPFLGSTTVRDAAALPVDFKGDLWELKYPVRWRNTGSAVRVVDQRAAVLNASNLIEDAALDRYEFIRDGYLQRRANKINRGRAQPASSDRDDGEPSSGPAAGKSPAGDTAPPQDAAPAPQPAAPKAPAGMMPQSSADKLELEPNHSVQLDAITPMSSVSSASQVPPTSSVSQQQLPASANANTDADVPGEMGQNLIVALVR